MGGRSSKPKTPNILHIRFPFQKKWKVDSRGAPDEESLGQSELPSGDDDGEQSIISVTDEDSDRGHRCLYTQECTDS